MNTMKKLAIVIALPVVLVLSACSVQGTAHTDVHASAASKPAPAVQTDPLLKGFGDVITYKDGVSVSVSNPAPFTPSEGAAQVANLPATMSPVLFTIVVTNNSTKPLELMGFPDATSGGVAAMMVSDVENNIGITPTSTLLPKQSITWQEGFGVTDSANITLQYRPSYEFAKAIFDSKH